MAIMRIILKKIRRLTLLCSIFLLQTACSTFGNHSDEEKESLKLAPVEDKSLINRNPYAPAGQTTATDNKTTNTVTNTVPNFNHNDSKKPSLHFEEVEELEEVGNLEESKEEFKKDTMPTSPLKIKPSHSYSLWLWPTDNQIIRSYDPTQANAKGIDFSGKVGDSVRAVRSGKVVFSGTALKGYGKLIIIKHDSNLLTAYAHNHSLFVKEGDLVDSGQVISKIGLNEQTGTPMLHFEVRLNGKPVDPLSYLPSR